MAKKIIWSNFDLDVDNWRDAYKEYLELNEMDDEDPNDEYAIYDFMDETNWSYLDAERANLNRELDGRILIIGDLGLWHGRVPGYRVIDKRNLNSFLSFEYDYAEFYGDGYNIRGKESHHDGTNYYLFREIREDRNIDNLLNAIYNGETISSQKLNYYTKSLYPLVKEIYGW